MSDFSNPENDPTLDLIEEYKPMVMKYWKRCKSAISFQEMVNEVYIRAKECGVDKNRGKKQVTTYMSRICYNLLASALKHNSPVGRSLGISLSRARAKNIQQFEKKLSGMENPTKAKNHVVVDSVWGSFSVKADSGSIPVFGNSKSHHVTEQEINLSIDIEENLSEVEQKVANMIISGSNLSAVSKETGIHPWSLRKTTLPRIAQKLDLKEGD